MRITTAFLPLTIMGAMLAQPTSAADMTDATLRRRAHMEEFNAAMQAVGQQIMGGKPDRAIVLEQAEAIHALAVALPGWFPVDSGSDKVTDSAALPGIWQNPVDFAHKADALIKASDALVQLAKNGDMRQLMGKAIAVDASCVACHQVYQKR